MKHEWDITQGLDSTTYQPLCCARCGEEYPTRNGCIQAPPPEANWKTCSCCRGTILDENWWPVAIVWSRDEAQLAVSSNPSWRYVHEDMGRFMLFKPRREVTDQEYGSFIAKMTDEQFDRYMRVTGLEAS